MSSNITVTRGLVTDWIGDTPAAGFSLDLEDGTYTVRDGAESFSTSDPAEALRMYADFIETFVGDQDEATATKWQAEIDKALADAAAIA